MATVLIPLRPACSQKQLVGMAADTRFGHLRRIFAEIEQNSDQSVAHFADAVQCAVEESQHSGNEIIIEQLLDTLIDLLTVNDIEDRSTIVADVLREIGWDLVIPIASLFKEADEGSKICKSDDTLALSNAETKIIKLLNMIGTFGNPREVFMSTMQFAETLAMCETDSAILRRNVVCFGALIRMLIIVIPRIRTNRLSGFISTVAPLAIRKLDEISHIQEVDNASRILNYIAQSYPELLNSLASTVLKHPKLPFCPIAKSEQFTELDIQRYLLTTFLMKIVELYIGNSTALFSSFHDAKYAIRLPKSEACDQTDMSILQSLLLLIENLNITLEYMFEMSDLLPEFLENGASETIGELMKAIPISAVGCAVIISLVSWTNFQTGKSLTSLNEQDPTLLIRTSFRLFPFVEILLSNPSNDGLCDKGLFLLQFIISSARPRSYFVDDDGAKPRIGIDADFDSFSRLAQTLTMFMTMSPNQSFRLQAFQNLSKFLALLPEDIEWRVLKDYLASLPYDSTISAIINLIKDRVHDGYISISPSSFYASPLFVSTFFPLLFDTSSHIYLPSQTAVGNLSRSVSILSSTTLFFDKVGIIMQVLNLWLYMLLRHDPRKSKSAVWTAAFLETTEQAYLEKLAERVEQLETDLNHGKVITQSHGERDEDNVSDEDEGDRQIELDNKLSCLNLLKSVILRIKQVINEGRAKRDGVDDEE